MADVFPPNIFPLVPDGRLGLQALPPLFDSIIFIIIFLLFSVLLVEHALIWKTFFGDILDVWHAPCDPRKFLEEPLKNYLTASSTICLCKIHYLLCLGFQAPDELKHEYVVIAELLDLELLASQCWTLGKRLQPILHQLLHLFLDLPHLMCYHPIEEKISWCILLYLFDFKIFFDAGLLESYPWPIGICHCCSVVHLVIHFIFSIFIIGVLLIHHDLHHFLFRFPSSFF